MSAVEKIIEIAKAEVGYLEKKTKSSLESKTDNAGSNNFTKYARDIYPSLQGQAWCDMFVDWCFVQAFGLVKAKQLLGGFSAYTPTSAQYFKNKGQYQGIRFFSAIHQEFAIQELLQKFLAERFIRLKAIPVVVQK